MATPTGKASTFELLRWSDTPEAQPQRTPHGAAARPSNRKPAGGASTFAFSEGISPEEAEALLKRKPLSETKKKEMCGNKLFTDEQTGIPCTPERSGAKLVQPPSQIAFGDTGDASPKKAATLAELAKQRELVGSQDSTDDIHWKKTSSNAKARELVGSNIFGKDEVPPPPPPKMMVPCSSKDEPDGTPGRATTPERKRAMVQKVAELSGNDIFKKDVPNTPLEKVVSNAKLKEMSGNDIFADDKPAPRDCLGGVRKPPGGESTIALV